MEMWKDAKFGDILSKISFEEPPFDLAYNSGRIYLPVRWELSETFHLK